MPPKLEVVDDAWGDQEKMPVPKRKKWKQSVGESLGEKNESGSKDKIDSQQRKRQKRDGKVKEQILGEQSLAETCPGGGVDFEAPAEVKTWANLREKERNQSILHFFQQSSSKVAENGDLQGGRAEKVCDLDNPKDK